jgi:hypothetical protein
MSYEELPRDVHLSIVKHFDIDTRIKTKLIGKLKIPPSFFLKLDKNLKQRLEIDYTESSHVVTICITGTKFYECYYDVFENQQYWYFVNDNKWFRI